MSVNLWGVSPLYVSPVIVDFINTSISRRQGYFHEKVSEGGYLAFQFFSTLAFLANFGHKEIASRASWIVSADFEISMDLATDKRSS